MFLHGHHLSEITQDILVYFKRDRKDFKIDVNSKYQTLIKIIKIVWITTFKVVKILLLNQS